MSDLGYVIIEWNQASGRPSIGDYLYDDAEEAEAVAARLRERTAVVGRREKYTVARVQGLGGAA